MKQHLTNLLIEQYKQQALIDNLYSFGVDLLDICVDNLEIIIDMVGFPKDNTMDYEMYNFRLEKDPENSESIEPPESDLFDREWLRQQYSETVTELMSEEQLRVREDGRVQVIEEPSEEMIKEKLSSYIDWLYAEYELYKSGNEQN